MVRGRLAAMVVAVVLVGGLAACTDDGGSEATPSPATTSLVVSEGWSLPTGSMAEVPMPPRANPNAPIAALADRFLLLGRLEDAGADATPSQLFDPITGAWTVLPPDPVDEPILFPEVVPIDDGFVVLGAQCAITDQRPDESAGVRCTPGDTIALRFDLADATWTELDPGIPDPPAAGTLVTDFGRPIGRAGGDRLLVTFAGALWTTYGGASDAWQRVDPPPFGRDEPWVAPESTCLVGEQFVAVDAPDRTQRASEGLGPSIAGLWWAAPLEDDGSWGRVPVDRAVEDLGIPEISQVVCAGQGALVLRGGDDQRSAIRFDVASGSWQEAARPPFEVGYVESAPTDRGAVVVLPDEASRVNWAYDWEADRWTSAPVAVPERLDLAVTADGVAMGTDLEDSAGRPVRYLAGRVQP